MMIVSERMFIRVKKKLFIIGGLFLVIIIGVILFLISNKKEVKDSIRFANEYGSVSEDNVFVYKNIDEIIKIMEYGTGVVYLGFPECPWCRAYVKYLNDVAIEVGIDEVYYYNILEDRTNNTEEYQKIVSILGDNLQYDKEGNYRIYVPNVSFHINGEVIGNDYETSYDTHGLSSTIEYWTPEEVTDLKERLSVYMEKVYKKLNSCTDCNK